MRKEDKQRKIRDRIYPWDGRGQRALDQVFPLRRWSRRKLCHSSSNGPHLPAHVLSKEVDTFASPDIPCILAHAAMWNHVGRSRNTNILNPRPHSRRPVIGTKPAYRLDGVADLLGALELSARLWRTTMPTHTSVQ